MKSIEQVRRVVHISTNIGRKCEHCDFWTGDGIDDHNLPESINHYIEEHGYALLHVGSETAQKNDGAWHSTVAVLGK